MTIHKPAWFRDDRIMVSTAPTCGLTKGGRILPVVDPETGLRVQEIDPETGALVDAVDDKLLADMNALVSGEETDTLRYVDADEVSLRLAVPTYYDRRYHERFVEVMQEPQFEGFTSASLGELVKDRKLVKRHGHGSPTQSVRVGTVPYIKVSDLRAGLVNINPTNRVPTAVARTYWRGYSSGLQPWDLICPERTSKNIGDFCMLMPGQEDVVTTKEVIVLRPGPGAEFDSFYLMWAMTLSIVREQWKRVIFMQTNREDVGERYLEIEIPIPPSRERADQVSQPFREYYEKLADARNGLRDYLHESGDHHFFIGTAQVPLDEEEMEEAPAIEAPE